jgi:hypothetical protein
VDLGDGRAVDVATSPFATAAAAGLAPAPAGQQSSSLLASPSLPPLRHQGELLPPGAPGIGSDTGAGAGSSGGSGVRLGGRPAARSVGSSSGVLLLGGDDMSLSGFVALVSGPVTERPAATSGLGEGDSSPGSANSSNSPMAAIPEETCSQG